MSTGEAQENRTGEGFPGGALPRGGWPGRAIWAEVAERPAAWWRAQGTGRAPQPCRLPDCVTPEPAGPPAEGWGGGRNPTPPGRELSELRFRYRGCLLGPSLMLKKSWSSFFSNSEPSSPRFDFRSWGSQRGEVGNGCTSLPPRCPPAFWSTHSCVGLKLSHINIQQSVTFKKMTLK